MSDDERQRLLAEAAKIECRVHSEPPEPVPAGVIAYTALLAVELHEDDPRRWLGACSGWGSAEIAEAIRLLREAADLLTLETERKGPSSASPQ